MYNKLFCFYSLFILYSSILEFKYLSTLSKRELHYSDPFLYYVHQQTHDLC